LIENDAVLSCSFVILKGIALKGNPIILSRTFVESPSAQCAPANLSRAKDLDLNSLDYRSTTIQKLSMYCPESGDTKSAQQTGKDAMTASGTFGRSGNGHNRESYFQLHPSSFTSFGPLAPYLTRSFVVWIENECVIPGSVINILKADSVCLADLL
jgi:hypothetical protein